MMSKKVAAIVALAMVASLFVAGCTTTTSPSPSPMPTATVQVTPTADQIPVTSMAPIHDAAGSKFDAAAAEREIPITNRALYKEVHDNRAWTPLNQNDLAVMLDMWKDNPSAQAAVLRNFAERSVEGQNPLTQANVLAALEKGSVTIRSAKAYQAEKYDRGTRSE